MGTERLSEEEVSSRCRREYLGQLEVVDFSGYTGVQSSVEVRCTTCGYVWDKRVANLIRRGKKDTRGCPSCSGLRRRTHDEFVKEVGELGGGEYEVLSRFTGTRAKVRFLHIPCREEFEMRAHGFLTLGHRCPSCRRAQGKRASSGEERIAAALGRAGLEFIREKTFPDLLGRGGRRLAFDFYVPDLVLLIEYDGEQHSRPVDALGGEGWHRRCVENDAAKDEYASARGIALMRVPHTEFFRIDSVVASELRNVQRLVREDVRPERGGNGKRPSGAKI